MHPLLPDGKKMRRANVNELNPDATVWYNSPLQGTWDMGRILSAPEKDNDGNARAQLQCEGITFRKDPRVSNMFLPDGDDTYLADDTVSAGWGAPSNDQGDLRLLPAQLQ